ncbi:MAG: response regulator transcription factor [Anaerolineales bacterium]|nr:MAG: response regulator transcription factor [Anaerolineales bacterium]
MRVSHTVNNPDGTEGYMPETILVVEDHEAVRRSLRDWLQVEFPQCRVIGAACGEDALALAGVESPHLVVMDISLPGMTGIEATRKLKANWPSAHILVLTIHECDTYREDAQAAGASAFVSKRSVQTELIPTVGSLLGRHADMPLTD